MNQLSFFKPPMPKVGMGRPLRRTSLSALAAASVLAACGGGETGPAVTSLQAGTATNLPMYGRSVSVTVTGSGLDAAGLNAAIEPGCFTMTRASGGTATSQTFTCSKLAAMGDLRVRIRSAEAQELAALRLDVPTPRVQFNARQGPAGGPTGSFVVELDPRVAPKSVDNFLAYANSSPCFYRDTLFHRVIAGKIVQGGGFKTGLTPVSTLAAIALESRNGLKNLRGTIAMARTEVPDSATSQFYINVSDNPAFDFVDDANPGYAVFGTVFSGMDDIDRLQGVPTAQKTVGDVTFSDVPVDEVSVTACGQIR